ncbi:MAG TPA: lytic transglycosylase domain-containing protein [Pyrinomonadaceae bacterium]|jgi:soluble lytic murein transglycosylase-like protein
MHKILPAAFALILFSAVSYAQVKAAKSPAPQTTQSKTSVSEREQFRQEFIKATADYEASLKTLSDAYETSFNKATEQNEKLKGLYTDGLISRRDMEASDATVAASRTQLEDVRKQIEQAAAALAAANNAPATDESPNLSTGASQVAHVWTTGNKSIDNLINYYGGKYGVDPYLVYCVMHQESRFGSSATSNKGAQGLMQLMPGTAQRYGVTNSYDPAQNIMGGTRYLKDLLNLFGGRIDLVLAGYNAGEGAVMKYGNRIPPYAETQAYVRVIGSQYGQKQHVAQPTPKTASKRSKVKSK